MVTLGRFLSIFYFNWQLVLPITWTLGKENEVSLELIAQWWSSRPAKFAGLHSKVVSKNISQLITFQTSHRINKSSSQPSLSQYLSTEPPSCACFQGSIEIGKDADFVVWDPETSFEVNQDFIFHKHKVSP